MIVIILLILLRLHTNTMGFRHASYLKNKSQENSKKSRSTRAKIKAFNNNCCSTCTSNNNCTSDDNCKGSLFGELKNWIYRKSDQNEKKSKLLDSSFSVSDQNNEKSRLLDSYNSVSDEDL